jgi:hypothetical protein
MTGLPQTFDIDEKCKKKLLQMLIIDIDESGKATNSFKIKIIDDKITISQRANIENHTT